MPLIAPDVLIGIADRVAAQYKILKEAVDSAKIGQDYHTRVNDTGDIDIQIPLLSPYVTADNNLTIKRLVQNFSLFPLVISSMDKHFADMGNVGSWDGYLNSHDLRVSDYFNQAYITCGSGALLAMNVFCEDVLTFATVKILDGSVEFIDGDDFGPGMRANLRADGHNFAPQCLGIYSEKPASSPVDLTISAKDWYGDVYDIEVAIEAGSTFTAIGNNESKFIDVMGIKLSPNGNLGTPGDEFHVKNIKEREVTL